MPSRRLLFAVAVRLNMQCTLTSCVDPNESALPEVDLCSVSLVFKKRKTGHCILFESHLFAGPSKKCRFYSSYNKNVKFFTGKLHFDKIMTSLGSVVPVQVIDFVIN